MNRIVRETIMETFNKLKNVVVGYEDLLKLLFIAVLTRGHILIEGFPGTGKTTVSKIFAKSIGGDFKRIQMTPDLLPADILGSHYYDIKRSEWILRKGPVFANVVFVDEINRASPRTQSALLEAMQERQVTIDGISIPLPKTFIVIATQMIAGSEGTYLLTPVLMDRFAYYYTTNYFGDENTESLIVLKAEEIEKYSYPQLVDLDIIEKAAEDVSSVYVSDKILKYIVRIVLSLRSREEIAIPVSPRASIWLYRGSRAIAYLDGLDYVVPDHVKWISKYVLPHRVHLKPQFLAENRKAIELIEEILKSVEVPK